MITTLHFLAFLAFNVAKATAQAASPTSSSGCASPSSQPSPSPSVSFLSTEEQNELFSLHEELVSIPSISREEIEISEFVNEYLTNLGYYVEKIEVDSGRFNVFAYPEALKDEGSWPEVLITSHLDTVPPFIPFERRDKNGTIYHYGRGTVDAKGCVAAQIIAAHNFFESRNDTPPVGMLFVVGEEIGGDGMKAFASHANRTNFTAAIFGEPTEGKLASGHKGSLGVTLNVTGKAAHSAYPWLGINAIDYLVEGITALNYLAPSLPSSELLGQSTLNVGRITGGLAGNIVPENANASVSIRVAGATPDKIKDMVDIALAPVIQRAEYNNATFNLIYGAATYGEIHLDTDVPDLEVAPVFYGTDIPSLPQVDKKYLFGSSTIQIAHTALEEISQDELVLAAEAYGKILRHLVPES